MIKAKVQLANGGRAFITEFETEQELHKAARTWLKGAKIRKINPRVRRALSNNSWKGHFASNPGLSIANGIN